MKTNTLATDASHEKTPITGKSSRERVTKRVADRVVSLYLKGLSTRDVAESVGIGKTTVLSVLHKAEVTLRARGGRR